jgi:hypothetical protein
MLVQVQEFWITLLLDLRRCGMMKGEEEEGDER